jgi:aerobic-type carbon monoxide dehydrogenase small subunit (CoxS/CutS family)
MQSPLLVSLTVIGLPFDGTAPPRKLASDFLREDMGLNGVRLTCEHGIGGGCTVLVDGKAVRSCLMLAVQTDGSTVSTVDGLAQHGELHPIQRAFWDSHGLQCSSCTPGMPITAYELLSHNLNPTEAELWEALGGNGCRCTGYVFIVKSILAAAATMRQEARR